MSVKSCPWCQSEGTPVSKPEGLACNSCGLLIEAVQKTEPIPALPPVVKTRRKIERTAPFNFDTEDGSPVVIGIDPGARNTGVVARQNDAVLYSTTIVTPDDGSDPLTHARNVAARTAEIVATFPGAVVGVESISAPKGYKDGKRSPLNPKHIMYAAAVAGAVAERFPDAHLIAPGGNGSQHESQYPPMLIGRRPKDLPGSNTSGTRNHERSAYDVAGKTQIKVTTKNGEKR